MDWLLGGLGNGHHIIMSMVCRASGSVTVRVLVLQNYPIPAAGEEA